VIVIDKQIIDELQEKIEQTQLNVERCVVDFMLLPNDKEKMYYAKDERGVLFRFGDFLGGRMDEIISSNFREQPLKSSLINIALHLDFLS
jgi:hypothetical protein